MKEFKSGEKVIYVRNKDAFKGKEYIFKGYYDTTWAIVDASDVKFLFLKIENLKHKIVDYSVII